MAYRSAKNGSTTFFTGLPGLFKIVLIKLEYPEAA
jgi:hypothetical protein